MDNEHIVQLVEVIQEKLSEFISLKDQPTPFSEPPPLSLEAEALMHQIEDKIKAFEELKLAPFSLPPPMSPEAKVLMDQIEDKIKVFEEMKTLSFV